MSKTSWGKLTGCSFLAMLTLTVAQMNLLAGLGGIALIIAAIGFFFADLREKSDKKKKHLHDLIFKIHRDKDER
jgi:glucose uptake protein GlcU